MWSNAWNGKSPSMVLGILQGLWFMLANFFFFMPKRKVTIEFQEQTKVLKSASKSSLELFNQTLEKFYNQK